MTHICVIKLTIIGSDNGLSPGRRQAIIWTNAGILLIGPLGTNFIDILIGIQTFSFKKMHLKMSSAKWRPFCLGLNVLNQITYPFRGPHIKFTLESSHHQILRGCSNFPCKFTIKGDYDRIWRNCSLINRMAGIKLLSFHHEIIDTSALFKRGKGCIF